MPGPEMLAAGGDIEQMELAAMERLGLRPQDFERYAKLTSGVRRKMLEFPSNVSVSLTDDGALEVCFDLSAGTYATTLLQEVASEVVDCGSQIAAVSAESDFNPETGE